MTDLVERVSFWFDEGERWEVQEERGGRVDRSWEEEG